MILGTILPQRFDQLDQNCFFCVSHLLSAISGGIMSLKGPLLCTAPRGKRLSVWPPPWPRWVSRVVYTMLVWASSRGGRPSIASWGTKSRCAFKSLRNKIYLKLNPGGLDLLLYCVEIDSSKIYSTFSLISLFFPNINQFVVLCKFYTGTKTH